MLHSYLVAAIASPPPHPSQAERLQLNTAALPDEALSLGVALVQRQLRAFSRPPTAAGSFVCGAADALQDARSAVRVPCVHIEPQPGFEPAVLGPRGGTPASAPIPPSAAAVPPTTDGSAASASGLFSCRRAGPSHETGGCQEAGEQGACSFTSASEATRLQTERHRLVVFQLQQMAVAMLVEDAAPQWTQPLWYSQLASLLVPELQPLAPLLASTHTRMTQLEEPYRFAYFNKQNLALKCSMKPSKPGGQRLGLATEIKLLVDRMHVDIAGSSGGGQLREVVLHAGIPGWVVGRGSASRGLYAILDGREYQWSEVLQEVQALMQSDHFNNIFLES